MQPKGPPPKPQAHLRRVPRAHGRGPVRHRRELPCKAFLDSNPTDADFLEIEKKHGTTAFTQLRTVPKWSDDPATEKKARANVEEVIKRSRAASGEAAPRPGPRRQVHPNLGATYEERVFAETRTETHRRLRGPVHGGRAPQHARQQPLRRAPERDQATRRAHDRQGGSRRSTASAARAARRASSRHRRPRRTCSSSRRSRRPTHALLVASHRPDAENDENRHASATWRRTSSSKCNPGVKVDFKQPEAKLVAAARTFYDHTARFAATKTNPDGARRPCRSGYGTPRTRSSSQDRGSADRTGRGVFRPSLRPVGAGVEARLRAGAGR